MKEDKKKEEQSNELEKYFDEKQYNTIIVGKDGAKPASDADLVFVLLDEQAGREERDEALKQLKEQNRPSILMEAIRETSDPAKKAKLVAACWETGIDFSSHLLFFTELVCSDDFSVALEAFTVIEQMHPFNSSEVKQVLQLVHSKLDSNPPAQSILEDLRELFNTVS